MHAVLGVVEARDACELADIEEAVNLSRGSIERILKLLEIDGAIERVGRTWVRTVRSWSPDRDRIATVRAQRQHELERIGEYVRSDGCLMQRVLRELDDPAPAPCGRCAWCVGPIVDSHVAEHELRRTARFLRQREILIEPRKRKPASLATNGKVSIDATVRIEEGRVLCEYGEPGLGEAVARGKYKDEQFADELVDAAAELIRTQWKPDPFPRWVAPVPSLRRPELVADFAKRLANALALPVRLALEKALDSPEQKTMLNGTQQATNVARSFKAVPEHVLKGPVLLVDDVVDSRWTMTACGAHLRRAGSGPVFPFALARASRDGGS
jgi:ATP-dependent DNA helicase RecQ